jgi:hypothetical protein
MSDDDRELLERIQQGDGESFGKLYDRTRGWLLSLVIVPRVGRADAEDVLAETYRVALEASFTGLLQSPGARRSSTGAAGTRASSCSRTSHPCSTFRTTLRPRRRR